MNPFFDVPLLGHRRTIVVVVGRRCQPVDAMINGVQTFLDAIDRAMSVAADRDALVCDGRRLTYTEFADRLERLHGLLLDLGLRPGDRVAIVSFNSIPFTELYCGVPMAGFVQVPLNFRWAEPELAYALEDSGARVLFCDRDPGPLADAGRAGDPDRRRRVRARCSTAATAVPFDRRRDRRGRPRRPVLHGRDDRGEQGRDADPPQPDRQR